MTRRTVAAIAIVLAGAACALGGCAGPLAGYSTSSVYPTEVSTVAVPIFVNDTFERGVEFELTDALIKEIQTRTPYRIASAARADTVLLGRVAAVELDSLSKSRQSGLSEEVILSVTIDFEWKDLRTDRTILARREFTGAGLFVPSAPTGETIELGRFNAVQQLAQDVVSEMRSSW